MGSEKLDEYHDLARELKSKITAIPPLEFLEQSWRSYERDSGNWRPEEELKRSLLGLLQLLLDATPVVTKFDFYSPPTNKLIEY